ncbi:hypothetical protein [Beggiatoa leptomitoformis]|uniref:Uncharacterized protein n=1 Tax=Beggiatoa leptomitoformis TaxID=288004 RepID=A0A2N9YH65_9GAMM|nr:hypothetical protein [Beggiatoa leptomitoformis]ALG67867.1 hypothetical protein AL038_09290 [Beggiatoa leptomitoformis]AUI69872.1 hypothetical protein BLE401_15010 [Beggiatoa leptomitoformis]
MRTKYTYSASATLAHVHADIIAILTGETDVNNLSASCNKASSSILTTISTAGWSVHDSSTGTTNKTIIKAPHADNASNYKYVEIYSQTSSLTVTLWEAWNETTNAGTNQSTAVTQPLNLTSGGSVYIWANPRYLVMASEIGASWGNSQNSGVVPIFELSRGQPWNTTSYPSFCLVNFYYTIYSNTAATYIPKAVDNNGNTVTGTNANCYIGSIAALIYLNVPSGATARVPDGSGGFTTPFYPLYLHNPSKYAAPVGQITSICDIWLAPSSLFSNLATIDKEGVTYEAVLIYSTGYHLLIPKG